MRIHKRYCGQVSSNATYGASVGLLIGLGVVFAFAPHALGRAGGGQNYRSSDVSSSPSSSSGSSSSRSGREYNYSGSSPSRDSSTSSTSVTSEPYRESYNSYRPIEYRSVVKDELGKAVPREEDALGYSKAFVRSPVFLDGEKKESSSVQAVYRALGPLEESESLLQGPLPFYSAYGRDEAHFDRFYNYSGTPGSIEHQVRLLLVDRLNQKFSPDDFDKVLSFLAPAAAEGAALSFFGIMKRTDWENFAATGALPFELSLTPGDVRGQFIWNLRTSSSGWVVFGLLTPLLWLLTFAFRALLLPNAEGDIGGIMERKETSAPLTSEQKIFLQSFRVLFLEVQKAWNLGDFKPVARFLSDGVRDRFEVAIRLDSLRGIRNVSDQMQILAVQILEEKAYPGFERKLIRVQAEAMEQTWGIESGKLVSRKPVTRFEELWSLIRLSARESSTRSVPDTAEIQMGAPCPSCGQVSSQGSDSSNCESCGTLLNSGETGWILAEITQGSEEKRAYDSAGVPGLQALKMKDPLFEPQYLEDRSSALLYRIFEARSRSRPDLLRPFVTPSLFESVQDHFSKPHPKGPYAYLAVGSAQVTRIENEVSIDGKVPVDRAIVELHWNAHERFAAPAKLVFVRDSKCVTPKRKLLMTFHCPSCGAPESLERDRPSCGHCGVFFNDIKGEWTLASFNLGDPTDHPGALRI